jgi:hypothetical protein
MAREFKAVRFFVLIAVSTFIVCGITVFYTQHAAHGRTSDERAGYAVGEKAGEDAPVGATLPTAADLNMIAQKHFKQHGSRDQPSWDLAFENGYAAGFAKMHRRPRE